MKPEKDKPEPRAKDARRLYRQARQLKRGAACFASAVPNSIIPRGAR